MADSETVLICTHEDDFYRPHVPKASQPLFCSRCKSKVGVSPASLLAAGKNAVLVCKRCALADPKIAEQISSGFFEKPTEAQLRELKNADRR
jgi:hypothetical protein